MGLADRLGSLEAGKRADLIVVSMSSARQTPIVRSVSHLVYVTRGDDVKTTIVNGRVLMQDRKVLTLERGGVSTRHAARRRKSERPWMDILIPAERIQQRIVELAREIERDHPCGEVHLVGVLGAVSCSWPT